MSSGVAPPVLPPVGPSPPPDPYEVLIDQRLHQTQRQLKGVDIAAGLLTLAVGALAYLFVAALVDHWLMPGGLGFWGRLLLLGILLAAGGLWFARQILPPLIYRISPLFAAHTIEQSRPSLKNSLINLLFLRSHRAEIEREVLAKRIYQGLQRTTAANLAQVSPETAVDRAHVIRLGYWLAGILAVCALYLTLSPKNPLVSFGRIIWPWADIQAPTRVTIDDVQPGDRLAEKQNAVEQGDYVSVSAQVRGLKAEESVLLYYSTADGQSVDQAVPMTRSEGEYRHRCQIPPGTLGIQQETSYFIVAGDGQTRPFRLQVQPALSIQVEAVDYRYPEYTGLPARTVERQGDLRAIEGTQVTIHAKASHPINRATMEMDCDPRHAVSMRPDGLAAIGQLTLAVDPENPTRGEHESYQLRFTDPEGHTNRRPIRHRIEVIPDLAPEVRLVEPPRDQIQLPVDAALDLRVRAEDPDFALRYVALRMEREGKSLPIRPLLNKVRPDKPHQGPLEAAYQFQPAKLGLKPGDKIVYLAEAADNKEPVANRSETERRTILIVPPEDAKSQQQRPGDSGPGAGRGTEGEKDGQSKPADQPQGDPGAEKPQDKQEQKGQAGAKPEEKTDQPQKPEGQDRQPGEGPQGEQKNQGDQPGSQGGTPKPGGSSEKQDPQSQQQPGEKDPGAKPDQGAGEGQPQDGGQTPGQKGDQPTGKPSEGPRQPIDGDSNAGDAFDQILQHQAEQEKKKTQQPDQQPPDKRQGQPEQQQPGQQQPGQQPSAQQQPAPGQSAQKQEPGTPQPGGQQGEQKDGAGQKQAQAGAEGQSAQKNSGQKDPAGQPAEKKAGAGERPQEGGQPGAKGGQEQPKPGEAKPPQGAEGEASGAQPGEKQRVPDSEQAGAKPGAPKEKPDAGEGMQAKTPDQPAQEQGKEKSPSGTGPRPDQRGGDPEGTKGTPGAGKEPIENKATPSPQGENRDRAKSPGSGGQKPSDQGESAPSPSVSPKSSDSQGETGGDRAGGGQQGGGQTAKKSGTGTAGTHTASEQGDAQAGQKGEGETGPKGGDQVKADRPTGTPAAKGEGPGSTGKQEPGSKPPSGQPKDQTTPESPGGKPGESSQPGQGQSASQDSTKPGPHGPGVPAGGGIPGSQQTDAAPPPPANVPGEEHNREFAERQTTLALQHLKDQLAKEKPDQGLLDRLGWSRQDLEKFVQRWEAMRRAAAEKGAGGETAKRKFDEALKSLGLRPHGTELRGGQVRPDQMRNLKDAGRFEPPPEWRELLRAYHRGVAGSKE